ncbi:MAG: GNAT family N-acetyltransferase [Chloroflexi bacterium]|nr:GNAT family N-acetyltransferase [Chloroflexota bacterium]
MPPELVPAKPEHVSELGRIAYEAFKDIHDKHGFPSDFSSTAFGRMIIGMLVQREDCYGVAAVVNGQAAGSNFLMTADDVGGLGPITVEVPLQGNGIGRALMQNVIDYARDNRIEMVRLLQDSFNTASLSLYASLGFDVKEPVALMEPVAGDTPDESVRPLTEADLPAVEEMSRRIYKVSRRNEVASLVRSPFRPFAREREGRVTGYFILGMPGHGVFETEDDAVALVREAARQAPPDFHRFLCPLTEGDLYRKLLAAGCRSVKVMNLMALGPYEPPDGVWMPSIGF